MKESVQRAMKHRGRAHLADPEHHELFVMAVWEALRRRFPALPPEVPDGLATLDLEHGYVRTARAASDSFFACDVVDLDDADAFELFHVRVADGSSRSGWRRHGTCRRTPPEPFQQALEFGVDATELPKPPPCFQLLASQLSGESVTAQSVDVEHLAALHDETMHLRDSARQQAEVIRQLRVALQHAGSTGMAAQEVAAPRLLKDINLWAAANADRIIVLPRAIAEARKSPYEDPELVYAALELLADDYRLLKAGQVEHADFKSRLLAKGLMLSASVGGSVAGEQGDSYFVAWKGRRLFLEQHLSRGVSRDSRYCLRVYFCWSDEDQKVLVGWLPSHLDNSRS